MTTTKQLQAACDYLNQDRKNHLQAPHGKWELDPGKLVAAVEFAGLQFALVPICCPFCGARTTISTHMVEWQARSLDPSDPGNQSTLDEHQCHDCHRSFWT